MEIKVPFIKRETGLGDAIAKATTAIGIKPCGGCKKRQEQANAIRFVPAHVESTLPASPGTLRVFHNSGLYVCLDLNVWGNSLEEMLEKAKRGGNGVVCGSTVAAYEKGVEERRLEVDGRMVVVRRAR